MTLSPGTRLGSYEILSHIGSGGIGGSLQGQGHPLGTNRSPASADVNAKDRNGNSPLTPATARGHTEIVKALLAAGAKRE